MEVYKDGEIVVAYDPRTGFGGAALCPEVHPIDRETCGHCRKYRHHLWDGFNYGRSIKEEDLLLPSERMRRGSCIHWTYGFDG